MPITLTFDDVSINAESVFVDAVKAMDNKTFQIHVHGNRMTLYEITMAKEVYIMQCCAVIHGTGTVERCGLSYGHEGKHMWANGD